jgi:RHS repeat-associated protein
LGLDLYDYGARFYNPSLGRWHNLDPYADKYLNLSPYNYVANNPLIFIDQMGKKLRELQKTVMEA